MVKRTRHGSAAKDQTQSKSIKKSEIVAVTKKPALKAATPKNKKLARLQKAVKPVESQQDLESKDEDDSDYLPLNEQIELAREAEIDEDETVAEDGEFDTDYSSDEEDEDEEEEDKQGDTEIETDENIKAKKAKKTDLEVPKIPELVVKTPQDNSKSNSNPKTKTNSKTQTSSNQKSKSNGGVVYVGRIPHGFYESQMRSYFGQFGTITNLRLSRNKRTGRSKHYAFIEFADEEVAQIVVDTMHNYLLYNRLLKCQLVANVHPRLFKGANRKFKPVDFVKLNAAAHNLPPSLKSKKQVESAKKRTRTTTAKRDRKLEKLGIEYSL